VKKKITIKKIDYLLSKKLIFEKFCSTFQSMLSNNRFGGFFGSSKNSILHFCSKFSFQLQDLGCILNWLIKENGKMKEITFSCWKNLVSSIKKLLIVFGVFCQTDNFRPILYRDNFSGRFNFICFFAEQLG
jgi:hypothetical protein